MSNEQGPTQSGRNVEFTNQYADLAKTTNSAELPTAIERGDIRPHPIKVGETELVLQRHGKYIRDRDDPRAGSLSEESAGAERVAATEYFTAFIEQIPEGERDSIDILFVASDTQFYGNGKRSYETAIVAQDAASAVLTEHGLGDDRIVNTVHDLRGDGGPRPMPKIREPQMFSQSPDFVDFLTTKYEGMGKDFWIAFEEDQEQATREELGAEGPDQIADRMAFSVRALARYAEAYHAAKPDKRLIIWADTHYDTISPFVKRDVFETDKAAMLLVDYGAGITIDIDTNGNATTELGGTQYDVPLVKPTPGLPEKQ